MRRKEGALVPLEHAICVAAAHLHARGEATFHGYLLARELKDVTQARRLTAYGTLYRALSRLQERGLVTSEWEDPHAAARENRPRRRLYSLTEHGLKAVRDAARSPDATPARRRRTAEA